MNIPDETRRIVQARIGERPEELARLRCDSQDRFSSYQLLLVHVYQRIRKLTGEDWREWVKIQGQVRHEVDGLVEELRRA